MRRRIAKSAEACNLVYKGGMKTYVIPKPAGIESLTLVDRPEPKPGPRQVLVRVRATSLNYRDLITIEGKYARAAPKPDLVPLSDGAGEVVAVGPDVSRVKPGDRVAGCFMQRWFGGAVHDAAFTSAMGGAIDGMLTEFAVLEEEGVVKLPAHLSFEEGATLPCAAVTAWHALVDVGRLKAGDLVQLQGTGGVSIFALQFARLFGARVIGTSSSPAKAARLRQMGAEAVIDYRTTPEWDQETLKFSGGRGVDLTIEVGGAGTLPRSFMATRVGGTIAVIGLLSGMAMLDPMPILRRNLRLQGIYVGSTQMFEAMNRAIEAAQLRPVIDKVFSFAEAKQAYKHLQSQSHFGKVVIAH
jgi:NADPH:quinone reductase-like Zn-dependent oxidoreductase